MKSYYDAHTEMVYHSCLMCVPDVYYIVVEIGDQRPSAWIDDFGDGG